MKNFLNLSNELNTDYKATSKVAELFENGTLQSDQLNIIPVGAKKSSIAKNIDGYTPYYSESKHKDCFTVYINRAGLYDMLPEGLFHEPPIGSTAMDKQQMLEDIKNRQREEKEARKFFMPFEAELNHMRVILEWQENRLDKKSRYNDFTNLFASEWKELEMLDNEQRIIWIHLLPAIQHQRNNLIFFGQLLTVLFKIPFRAAQQSQKKRITGIDDDMLFSMGSGSLGINTVIGDTFESYEDEVTLFVGPAETEELIKFIPGTAQSALIDLVTSYLLPVETVVTIELLSDQQTQLAILGPESNHSLLGYTVFL
ncbi:type VI secretion system baseplate subunit TssG [Pedobacter sp. MC2016-15]|uniref:type VI secretion system baseplate subunit TssG n=1 Tax=Pedobacter sp. MC2016-15 TaxID=2994473 RepID=UPI002246FBC2|nr:type VI secretion system baseplate subunit TssG [Pedobacter sp. MC2016-15]MCX2478057.1 type VI secretion system baseplate subunit TssG [Pedobacter sp. MC2016-15]